MLRNKKFYSGVAKGSADERIATQGTIP